MNLLLCMNNCSGFYFISSVDFFSTQHHSNIAAAIHLAPRSVYEIRSIWFRLIGNRELAPLLYSTCEFVIVWTGFFVWICLHFSNTSSKCVCQTVMIWPKGIVIGQVYNHLKSIAKIVTYFVKIQSPFRQLKQVNHMETMKIMEKFMESI